MSNLTLILSVFLLANLLVALLRVARGPTPADRRWPSLLLMAWYFAEQKSVLAGPQYFGYSRYYFCSNSIRGES